MRYSLGTYPGTFEECINFGFGCYGWVSQPTTDPLVFWPPVGDHFIEGRFTVPLPPDAYAMKNISEPISGGRMCFLLNSKLIFSDFSFLF